MISPSDFELFEKQFTEFISTTELLYASESRLRETLRTETMRADTTETDRDVANKISRELQASMAAATTKANKAAEALAAAQDDLTNTKIKLDIAEYQNSLFEEKCAELSQRIAVLEQEVQECKPLQTMYAESQKQFVELLEKVQLCNDLAKSEATRLENELRRVEKCASAGTELRERARLAAAAHARERQRASDELRDITMELHSAKAEVLHLKILVLDLQYKLQDFEAKSTNNGSSEGDISLSEAKAALDAERRTIVRLESALASALSDNADLAAELHRQDVKKDVSAVIKEKEDAKDISATNICAIDSFLAD